MKIPDNCPICNGALENTPNPTTPQVIYKNCYLQSNHHIFSCTIYNPGFFNNDKEVIDRIAFTLSMFPPLSIIIFPEEKKMAIAKCLPSKMSSVFLSKDLPFYIEPDFSDYHNLINKLKLYILFS